MDEKKRKRKKQGEVKGLCDVCLCLPVGTAMGYWLMKSFQPGSAGPREQAHSPSGVAGSLCSLCEGLFALFLRSRWI